MPDLPAFLKSIAKGVSEFTNTSQVRTIFHKVLRDWDVRMEELFQYRRDWEDRREAAEKEIMETPTLRGHRKRPGSGFVRIEFYPSAPVNFKNRRIGTGKKWNRPYSGWIKAELSDKAKPPEQFLPLPFQGTLSPDGRAFQLDDEFAIVAAVHDFEYGRLPSRLNPWGDYLPLRGSLYLSSEGASLKLRRKDGSHFVELVNQLSHLTPDVESRLAKIVEDVIGAVQDPSAGNLTNNAEASKKRGRPQISKPNELRHKKIIAAWGDGKKFRKYDDCAHELGEGFTAVEVKRAVDREGKRKRDVNLKSIPHD